MQLYRAQRLCIQALFEYGSISVFSIAHQTGHLMVAFLFYFLIALLCRGPVDMGSVHTAGPSACGLLANRSVTEQYKR